VPVPGDPIDITPTMRRVAVWGAKTLSRSLVRRFAGGTEAGGRDGYGSASRRMTPKN